MIYHFPSSKDGFATCRSIDKAREIRRFVSKVDDDDGTYNGDGIIIIFQSTGPGPAQSQYDSLHDTRRKNVSTVRSR